MTSKKKEWARDRAHTELKRFLPVTTASNDSHSYYRLAERDFLSLIGSMTIEQLDLLRSVLCSLTESRRA